MNKFLILLLCSHVVYINAETSTFTTEAYTSNGIPTSDLHCPGSMKRQSFQGNNNFVCRVNGVEQSDTSTHAHIFNSLTEYRTQLMDFDDARAPNRKEDACVHTTDRTKHGSATTQADCTDADYEFRGGSNGLILAHSGQITQVAADGTRSSSLLNNEFFRERFIKSKATLTVDVANNENQIYEGCDVQFSGSSIGDLKDFLEFIPNHRALGSCVHNGAEKTLGECTDKSAFRPIPADDQCDEETGKCDNAVLGAAEFRIEGVCTIAVGSKFVRNNDFCEDSNGDVVANVDRATCIATSGNVWNAATATQGKIVSECGVCRSTADNSLHTNTYSRKSDCDDAGAAYTWQSSSNWVKNDQYSCVFYLANNKFVGETSVIVSFHKDPSTVGNGGKAIHSLSIPVGFSPHSSDPDFKTSHSYGIVDSELQNKYFRDAAVSYSSHCHHRGGYVAPYVKVDSAWQVATSSNCEPTHTWNDCLAGVTHDMCTYANRGTLKLRFTGTFVDTRYKVVAQKGVERLPTDVGNFLLLKSGLELHEDYRSFNDPSLDDFSEGNDNTITMRPIKFDDRKTPDLFGGGTPLARWTNVGKALGGHCLNDYSITDEATCVGTNDANGNPYVWDADYPDLQQVVPSTATAEGSLDDAYACDPQSTLRSDTRGNCHAQYSMAHSFSLTYGALPHFDKDYIGCPLCANELIIKGFKEDTDNDVDNTLDTYQVNTKIPISLSDDADGLGLIGRATNEIELQGIDLQEVSSAALLEPKQLQRFSFIFEAVEDSNNLLRREIDASYGWQKALPTSLDQHIKLDMFFSAESFQKVVPVTHVVDSVTVEKSCAYEDGYCCHDDSSSQNPCVRTFHATQADCEAQGADYEWITDEYECGSETGVSCDLGRNLCIQENAIAVDDSLKVFQYKDENNANAYGCPDLYKCVYPDGDDSNSAECTAQANLKLFRLSLNPAEALQRLFETTCKMYIPENGYGSTYKISYENSDESNLGTCVLTLNDASTVTLENVECVDVDSDCDCTPGNSGKFSSAIPSGKTVSTAVHTKYDYEGDRPIEATVKELKTGRNFQLETTQLSLNQRLEVASVFQRVATTVTLKLSKDTISDPTERLVFRIRGSSATLDGFTAENAATQLADECAAGPRGDCIRYAGATSGRYHQHECGVCKTSGGGATEGLETELTCVLAGRVWHPGTFTAPTADTRVGYAWKRHTIREYICDDILNSANYACRVPNGTCIGGNENLGSSSDTCETAGKAGRKWYPAAGGGGRCMTTFEACEKENGGTWNIESKPLLTNINNYKTTLITECQPDSLTDGQALQSEVLFVTPSTNGETLAHSIRTTKECTGTVDLQFEDQALGQEFAIYTSRIPCSRVSTADLSDKVDLKYKYNTALDIAQDRLTIDILYSDKVLTEGECEDTVNHETYDRSMDGDDCTVEATCTSECKDDYSNADFFKTYSVDSYFGVCKNDKSINSKAGLIESDTVINSANCARATTPITNDATNGNAKFEIVSQTGLQTLIECASTDYAPSTCCNGCKCETDQGVLVTTQGTQNEKGCLAANSNNVWTGPVETRAISGAITVDNCGYCDQNTACLSSSCCDASQGQTWYPARTGGDATKDAATYPWLITDPYLQPSVNTLAESYVITYSLALQYTRRVTDNAFAGSNSGITVSSSAGQIKYCQDQIFTASIRRDASASVVVSQVKAAELNRAVLVKDITWIEGSSAGCNEGEFRIEVLFMVMDQDARYQDLGYNEQLGYWEKSKLRRAMIDTAADAQNPNSMIIKTVSLDDGTTTTIIREPADRCSDLTYYDNADALKRCVTASCIEDCVANGGTVSSNDVGALESDANDQNHFKVLGQCIPITQCLTDGENDDAPISDGNINGNSWSDYSVSYVFDLVVRGEFLKADVDTKIEVTSNFQECPVDETASISGVPRVGVQLGCFEPVSFNPSAMQWIKHADVVEEATYLDISGELTNPSVKCVQCHQASAVLIDLDQSLAASNRDYGLYNFNKASEQAFCEDGEETTEAECEAASNTRCGPAFCEDENTNSRSSEATEAECTAASKKWRGACIWVDAAGTQLQCCPMDCSAAYADDLAQTDVKVFVTDDQSSALTNDGYSKAQAQDWSIESSEIFIERYDTSTISAQNPDPTLIGEVRLCICPDPLDASKCKVDNSNPYGLSSFNQHYTVTKYCIVNGVRDDSVTSSADCSGEWTDGIEEYFMICGGHTAIDQQSNNFGKEAGLNANYYSNDLSVSTDFGKAQINLMPLAEAPADEFRIRYDVILKTGKFNARRRLRTSTVVRKSSKKLKDIKLGDDASSNGIQISYRPANAVEPTSGAAEEPVKHETSDSMETGTVFLIVASSMLGVGLMIWGVTLLMDKGEAASVEETTGLVSGVRSVASAVTRKPRFDNLRY